MIFALLLSGLANAAICALCYQSFISLNISSSQAQQGALPTLAVVHATYYDPTIVQSGKGTSPSEEEAGTNVSFMLKNATNASITFRFEGNPIVDDGNKIACEKINTSASGAYDEGSVSCTMSFFRDPYTLQPNPLWNYSRCGMLSAELVQSYDEPNVKPSTQSVLLCPAGANSLTGFSSLGSVLSQNPSFYLACFPGFLIVGVLIASMYYAGRNPLSLFDITTPRLPAGKKVRMPRANVPYGLAHKPRINDRVIARTEKAMLAQLVRLYGKGKRGNITDVQRQVKQLFKKESDSKKVRSRLLALADESGMTGQQLLAAKRAIERISDIREAAALDKAVFGSARSGGPVEKPHYFQKKYGRNWPGSILNKYASKLGKPWKFIPGVEGQQWADRLPGLPYVERMTLVGANWFGSRYGNIKMRQEFRKAIRAEAGVALGVLKKDSKFVEKWGFDKKRMGNIPRILERMHQETFLLGRSIQEEAIRKIIEQMALSRREEQTKYGTVTTLKINEARMKEILKIVHRLEEERKSAAARNVDFAANEMITRELAALAKKWGLIDYRLGRDGQIQILRNGHFYTIDGNPDTPGFFASRRMTSKELEYLLNLVRNAERIMSDAASISKGTLARDGRNPIFEKDGKNVPLDPEKTYGRYTQMFELLAPYREQWRNGRIPLIMLANDLAEYVGRILKRTDLPFNEYRGEEYRLARIRLKMEEEIALRNLFKQIMDQKSLRDESGILKVGWRKELANIADPSSRREVGRFSYTERGEFAARHYITGYSSISHTYIAESERHKIEILRQMMANTYDKSWENLFKNYELNVRRNSDIYLAMRNTHEIYTGIKDWNWDTYAKWLQQGVTYGDMKKGVWIIGPNYVRPLAGLNMDAWRRNGEYRYDMARVAEVIGSPYSERIINGSILIRQADGQFRRGAPMKDPEVRRLIYKYTNDQYELVQALPTEGGLSSTREGRQKRDVLEGNLRSTGAQMDKFVQIRSRAEYGETGSVWSRASQSFAQFLERTFGAGTYYSTQRFNQWYAAQTYMRVMLDSFSPLSETAEAPWAKSERKGTWKEYLSEEANASFEAKQALAEARRQQLQLLAKPTLTSEESKRLSDLRAQVSDLQSKVPSLERAAREADRKMGRSDRAMRELADMSVPYYNINEHTVMRDPRIAPGGGYGIRQAIMTSYQSGQFVGERPGIWAGMNVVPGDRLLNQLAKPSYLTSLAFGTFNRTFFTKSMGYTTVYNMNPENGPETERYQFRQGIQSIFRPAESFDWFTRLMARPIWRGKGSWSDEFGYTIREGQSWSGSRFIFPFTMKAAGADDTMRTDEARMRLLGIGNVGQQVQTRRLGSTFREEYKSWEQNAFQGNPSAQIRSLQARLATAASAEERRSIEFDISRLQDQAKTENALWRNIPGIGRFFQSGYYAIENRAGYDVSAQGGAHRPWELYSAYYKNMAPPGVPGMLGKTWEGDFTLFPRVASMMIESPRDFNDKSTGLMVWKNADIDKAGNLRKMMRLGAITEERAVRGAAVGTVEGTTGTAAIYKEALKDPYRVDRYESNMLYHFMTLEEERMGYSLLNSPFVMPLAPPVFGLYHLAKRLPFRGNPVREWMMASDNIYEKKLTDSEAATAEGQRRERMEAARRSAGMGEQVFWTCPTHNIRMRYGEICPLCHNKEEDIQNSQKKTIALKRYGYSAYDTVKSFAYSLVPFSGAYNHYMNQAHCPTHGIAFGRGTNCPLCADKDLLEARQLVLCRIHNVAYEKGKTCWKCSGREPSDYERIGDMREKYAGQFGTDAYKERIRKDMNIIKRYEDQNRTVVE